MRSLQSPGPPHVIAQLTGRVEALEDGRCIIDVNGVGYLVHASTRTLAALSTAPDTARLLVETQPDVLILDIDLPGESGMDLLQYGNIQRQSLLIVMLTNYDHPKLRERCAELGANFYFHKPTEIEKTMDVCRELVARRESSAALELQKECDRLDALMRDCLVKLKEAHANLRRELSDSTER